MSNINIIKGLGLTVGELAVKQALITSSDLEKAVRICADLENSHDAIPEYLVAQNLVSQNDCEKLIAFVRAMKARGKDIRFGNIAIAKGFITQSILELALEEQSSLFKNRKKYTLLGDILVDAGMLTSQQRDVILLEQNRHSSGSDDSSGQDKNGEFDSDVLPADESSLLQGAAPGSSRDSLHKHFAQSEVFPSGIRLIIKGDGNAAYLFKTKGFNKEISIGQIKELLASRNIIHGIADNNLIQKFIDSDIFYSKPFKIAEGNAPVQGKNASIQYFFTKNRLKAGTIREDGTIDFRERGNIPQVEKGAVLAVKRNAVEGKVGKNIFNDTVRVMPTRDIRLKPGKGTFLSPDKLKVIASVSGHPKLASDGTIYVYDTFVVEKDVDFETGNIDYHGDVTVRGCIQNGFKVRANNVRATEVDGATIIAQGNVTIEQGVNESSISAQGSLGAKFIQNSRISCVGDVTTEKEVVESNIECSGTCNIKGVIIYSRISSKMGLYARQIGMEKAPPSTIRVGTDTFAERSLKKLQQDIAEKKESEAMFIENISRLRQEIEDVEGKIVRLTAIKERYEDERMDLLSSISSMDTNQDIEKIKKMQSELDRIVKNSTETSRKLAMCHESIRAIRQTIADTEQKKKENLTQIKELLKEKDTLVEWVEKNPGIPMVKVEGDIMAGTHIFGRYSEETIKSSVKAVVIKEDQVSRFGRDSFGRENEANLWKMYVTKI
ncbi:MAG: DUF342 domain-containing protein [Desulfamplus sp.]|nr:DUF342 domain-containing protein [Desulfamplus sp.]